MTVYPCCGQDEGDMHLDECHMVRPINSEFESSLFKLNRLRLYYNRTDADETDYNSACVAFCDRWAGNITFVDSKL